MLTRNTVIRLVVFAVVGLVAVVYTAMRYAGIGSSVLNPGYAVQLQLASSGGLFTNSEVAYRGVTVGKVTAMHLTATGLVADLHIDASAPKIPASLKASVADRSAVGEQYVNLVPSSDAGPYLADGAVIPQSETSIPLPTQDLLSNLDALATSVPTGALATTVSELGDAFNGTGTSLQRLLDSVADFTQAAQSQLPQTTQLLDNSETVLNTQNAEGGALISFANSLNTLSAQLKTSDPQIRTLIANVPPAATQITYLLNETGPALSSVIANLLTTADILVKRTSGLELMFVAYPMTAAATETVVPGDGTAHLGLVLNLFNPAPCTAGYQSTTKRSGDQTGTVSPNTSAYCAAGSGSATDVRGAQDAPYGGSSGVATGSGAGGGSSQASDQTPATGSVISGGDSMGPTSLAQLLGVG